MRSEALRYLRIPVQAEETATVRSLKLETLEELRVDLGAWSR